MGRDLTTPVLLLALAAIAFASGRATGRTWSYRTAHRPARPADHRGRFLDINLCGWSELRIDDAPVVHRVDVTVRPRTPGLLGVFMVMQVPSTASPGPHRIQLLGPAHGGPGSVCGNVTVHQEELDAVDIEITP